MSRLGLGAWFPVLSPSIRVYNRRRRGNLYYVGRAALLTVVLVAVLVGTASAGSPKRTAAAGTITVLAPKRIVVDSKRDVSCRISASLARIMRVFAVGDHAKIVCRDGVLSSIL